jgi:hypothetical protein
MSGHKSHDKIARLCEFGFAQLVEMMASRPTVIGLSNISGKLAELREVGVKTR